MNIKKLFPKSKKGIAMSFLVTIMSTLIGFVLLSYVLSGFMSSFNEKQTENMCHNSIALRGSTALNVGGDEDKIEAVIKAIPVTCTTIDLEVTGTKEEIMEEIAYRMARTWWMFGEGRYEELLHDSEVTLFPKLFGTQKLNNECFNSYTITIDQDEIKDEEGNDVLAISSEDLITYFSTHNHPQYNVTYLNYIQSYGGDGRVMFQAGTSQDAFIIPHGSYTISFMPKNKDPGAVTWWDPTKIAIGTAIVVGAVVVGTVVTLCVVGTAGACAVPLATGAAWLATAAGGLTAGGATLGGIGLVAGGTAIAGGSGALFAYSGTSKVLAQIYGEREVSSVYLSWLEDGQAMCGSGDLAGE
ncbi:MAG: hypothetical protein ABIG93_01760 [archaeon]|nr:hypothetical protein [Nanoarchaeota archaeon]